jgi:acyl-CoA dehydrogenase
MWESFTEPEFQEKLGTEGYIRYNQVRVPLDAMLGAPGEGFKVAQSRLGGGRIHHAMRVVGNGSLGTTQETPLGPWWSAAPQLALADGPTEVHKAAVAKLELRGYQPAPGLFPTEHIPTRRAEARARYAAILAEHGL